MNNPISVNINMNNPHALNNHLVYLFVRKSWNIDIICAQLARGTLKLASTGPFGQKYLQFDHLTHDDTF